MRPILLVSALALVEDARAADRLAYYADIDHDGYGNSHRVRYATGPTAGYTRQMGDCDDRDASVHPDATELCNGLDDDCDRLDDDEDTDTVGRPSVWYADMDSDGFGDPRARLRTCVPPYGYVLVPDDCDDGDEGTNPLAFEFCSDGDDDDCDGHVDECVMSLDDAALVVDLSAAGISVYGRLAVADLDADGTGDLAVANAGYDAMNAPTVYLLYGPVSGRAVVDDDVTIAGTETVGRGGVSVAGGDADGDAFDDLLVGGDAGVSPAVTYVFLGPVTADRDVSDADAMLTNVSREYMPLDVLVMSDHDGDGDADITIGSADDGDGYDGAVYVVPGTSTGTVALDSDATYMYVGDGVDFVGAGIADLGDVDGDGIAELAIGATWASTYIIQGGMAPGAYTARDVATTTIAGNYRTGEPLQAIDYDGDGAMDLVAGDNQARNSNGDPTGGVYVFVAPWAEVMDVDDATAAWEWTSTSAASLGSAFAAADFDGNGETDLIIGAPDSYDGAVFFQWGVASGLVDVGSLPYVTGAFDRAALGIEVVALPDWNGDGVPEVAIESWYGPDRTAGAIYGFFSGSY